MTMGQAFLWLVALVALGFCLRRGPGMLRRVGTETGQSLLKILPLFAVALPIPPAPPSTANLTHGAAPDDD